MADEHRPAAVISDEEEGEALVLLEELFGINTDSDPDPLIDMPAIARFAGVAPGTPSQWQQRTRGGLERVPFPVPDDVRYRDKPQWRAISTVLPFLKLSGRWPRGSSARPAARDPEKLNYVQLTERHAKLAEELWALRADDRTARTLQGWRAHLTRTRNKAATR